ncbi:unnamed protein product, partial [Pneumocystis jirovecii]
MQTEDGIFQGIIETIGLLSEIKNLNDIQLGDSISVNGACLTVTEINNNLFRVNISPETLKRTNFGNMVEGEKVNLERAIMTHKRFGGHFVQGHIDTTATI